MKDFWQNFLLYNWPRKLVAIVAAIIVWFLVSQSMTLTRTIPDIAVRIINIPNNKTVEGLLPNGQLNQKITVSITGQKSTIQDIRSNDLEVVIDAEGKKEGWIAPITKRSLISTSPHIDIYNDIYEVAANDIFIKLTKLISEEIPIIITKPIGDPPKGYQFLDIWPKELYQLVSGPEEQVLHLKERGLELTFNLNKISKTELDSLQNHLGTTQDEVSFHVPLKWKQIAIPFQNNVKEPLNDPRSEFLRIDFLRQDLIPLKVSLPIAIFFPLKYSNTINPETYSLAVNSIVEKKNGLKLLNIQLYAKDVSRLFLDTVRDNMQLTIIAAPKNVRHSLDWTIEFIGEQNLENGYVITSMEQDSESQAIDMQPKLREEYLRNRFRNYKRNLELSISENQPLELRAELQASTINLELKTKSHLDNAELDK